MSTTRTVLARLALLALAMLLVSDTLGARGGKKPKPPPPPADPAIAYTTNASPGVWVMNADGSNQTAIHSAYVHGVSWSGDGDQIAFTTGVDHDLWRLDVDVVDGVPQGSNVTRLVADPDVRWPAWSPTSDTIAFIACPSGVEHRELRLVPASGGTQTTLYTAPEGRYIKGAEWSSDGTRIAFLERIGSGTFRNVRVLTVATGAIASYELPLSDGHSDKNVGFGGFSWARTDDVLAYVEETKIPVNRKKSRFCFTVRTLDLATGITEAVVEGLDPCWSPDDSKLVLRGVDVLDLATGVVESLTSEYGLGPDWRR